MVSIDNMEFSSNLVSIIMPVHNRFELATQAIGSVISQSYRPIELIIVDDCSDIEYLPQVTSKDQILLKIVRQETNIGPGASRESGRLLATGDYICYLDSDDLWHKDKLAKQVSALRDHPQVWYVLLCFKRVFSVTNN